MLKCASLANVSVSLLLKNKQTNRHTKNTLQFYFHVKHLAFFFLVTRWQFCISKNYPSWRQCEVLSQFVLYEWWTEEGFGPSQAARSSVVVMRDHQDCFVRGREPAWEAPSKLFFRCEFRHLFSQSERTGIYWMSFDFYSLPILNNFESSISLEKTHDS